MRRLLALSCTIPMLTACAPKPEASKDTATAPAAAPAATTASPDSGWKNLVDGNSLAAWKGYKSDSVPAGWTATDGVVNKKGPIGDLVSRDKYGDFELALEWRIAPGGNAGVFYHGTEEYDHVYWSAPEYQLLDDAKHPDGKSRLTSAGAAYALYPPPAGVVKPADQWNETRIVVKGAHVEHWLNGQKVVEYELGSPDWEAKVKASKFKDWPNYGRAKSGVIAIQGDHDGELSLRNIRIRELK